ncbi:MAG: site-specific DNA-methyltransferase [Firmicutes bacterium]|nr:site-specific DNA-methyltransferase [Bacillota bacterium]
MDNNKLGMISKDIVGENISKLRKIFPNVISEGVDDNGEVSIGVDFDKLRIELSKEVSLIEGEQERYEMNWPRKREHIREAQKPSTNSLQPDIDGSVSKIGEGGFDSGNLYIEGDNMEVLKLMRDTYRGKIKMIYIDPPYNTGKDFIYKDNRRMSVGEYEEISGEIDEEGNRVEEDGMVVNSRSNPRFHTDWLNFIYPRLWLSRDMLAEDGVIFVSIDDNEVHNLRKVCDEIFGAGNFVGEMIRKTKSTTNDAKTGFNLQHENLIIYATDINKVQFVGELKDFEKYKNHDNDPAGAWVSDNPSTRTGSYFEIKNPITGTVDLPPLNCHWRFSEKTFKEHVSSGKIKFKEHVRDGERGFVFKRYLSELRSNNNLVNSLLFTDNQYMNQVATKEKNELMGSLDFAYPKPLQYIKKIVQYSTGGGATLF